MKQELEAAKYYIPPKKNVPEAAGVYILALRENKAPDGVITNYFVGMDDTDPVELVHAITLPGTDHITREEEWVEGMYNAGAFNGAIRKLLGKVMEGY